MIWIIWILLTCLKLIISNCKWLNLNILRAIFRRIPAYSFNFRHLQTRFVMMFVFVFRFRVMFSIFILMGVSWMMEIISFVVGGIAKEYIWIPTDVINILTGLFIFVIFVCKRNVWKLLAKKWSVFERIDRRFGRNTTINRRGTTSTSAPSRSQPLPADSIRMKIRSSPVDGADDQPDSRLTGDFEWLIRC